MIGKVTEPIFPIRNGMSSHSRRYDSWFVDTTISAARWSAAPSGGGPPYSPRSMSILHPWHDTVSKNHENGFFLKCSSSLNVVPISSWHASAAASPSACAADPARERRSSSRAHSNRSRANAYVPSSSSGGDVSSSVTCVMKP